VRLTIAPAVVPWMFMQSRQLESSSSLGESRTFSPRWKSRKLS